jgi:hypothetical protein
MRAIAGAETIEAPAEKGVIDMFDTNSVKVVERYLDKFGWKAHLSQDEPGEKEGVVATGWTDPAGRQHVLLIDPMQEKKALSFRAPILEMPLDSTPTERVNSVLLAISALNTRYVLGGFAYNPNDGWLEFKLTIPSTNGGVEYAPFEHSLTAVTATVDEMEPEIQAIASGSKTAQDVLAVQGIKA